MIQGPSVRKNSLINGGGIKPQICCAIAVRCAVVCGGEIKKPAGEILLALIVSC